MVILATAAVTIKRKQKSSTPTAPRGKVHSLIPFPASISLFLYFLLSQSLSLFLSFSLSLSLFFLSLFLSLSHLSLSLSLCLSLSLSLSHSPDPRLDVVCGHPHGVYNFLRCGIRGNSVSRVRAQLETSLLPASKSLLAHLWRTLSGGH